MQFMDSGSVVARDISEVDAGILDNDSGSSAWLTLPVRNIGTGAARCLAAVAAFATKDSAGGPVESGRAPPVVPANQHAVVGGFQDTPGLRALIASQEEIVIEVAYMDISGNQLQATSIFFVPTSRIPIRRVEPGHGPELTIPRLREMGIVNP
jgi:hypothetical protein